MEEVYITSQTIAVGLVHPNYKTGYLTPSTLQNHLLNPLLWFSKAVLATWRVELNGNAKLDRLKRGGPLISEKLFLSLLFFFFHRRSPPPDCTSVSAYDEVVGVDLHAPAGDEADAAIANNGVGGEVPERMSRPAVGRDTPAAVLRWAHNAR